MDTDLIRLDSVSCFTCKRKSTALCKFRKHGRGRLPWARNRLNSKRQRVVAGNFCHPCCHPSDVNGWDVYHCFAGPRTRLRILNLSEMLGSFAYMYMWPSRARVARPNVLGHHVTVRAIYQQGDRVADRHM